MNGNICDGYELNSVKSLFMDDIIRIFASEKVYEEVSLHHIKHHSLLINNIYGSGRHDGSL